MSTTSTPFPIALAACHAGQAARSELGAAVAREDALYQRGRRVLSALTTADLAEMLEDVYAACYAAQLDGFDGADKVDLDFLEDAAGILRSAGRR